MSAITSPSGPATTLPRDTVAPVLASFAAIHDAMVRDARRLAVVVAALPVDQGPQLRTWWELYEQNIVHHHEREDEIVFPLVAERDPGFDPAQLVADHGVLDEHMAQVRRSVEDLATGRRELGGPRSDLVGEVQRFGRHLDDHLGREEQIVFPVLATKVSADEYAAIETEMRKGMPLRALSFTLPWILDDLDPGLAANADIPALLRVLDRWFWERRYARLSAPLHLPA